eukprot:TRINITY_DN1517_c0_g1_i1.p1 TRINITY_DN1517_c0_g1~~TRINITY_DN1517_c0_g1_i1.p1  ORF type:complete len:629 (+),score=143.63 TRINITY_DN1517_c0_g1_i1:240-1889(+)
MMSLRKYLANTNTQGADTAGSNAPFGDLPSMNGPGVYERFSNSIRTPTTSRQMSSGSPPGSNSSMRGVLATPGSHQLMAQSRGVNIRSSLQYPTHMHNYGQESKDMKMSDIQPIGGYRSAYSQQLQQQSKSQSRRCEYCRANYTYDTVLCRQCGQSFHGGCYQRRQGPILCGECRLPKKSPYVFSHYEKNLRFVGGTLSTAPVLSISIPPGSRTHVEFHSFDATTDTTTESIPQGLTIRANQSTINPNGVYDQFPRPSTQRISFRAEQISHFPRQVVVVESYAYLDLNDMIKAIELNASASKIECEERCKKIFSEDEEVSIAGGNEVSLKCPLAMTRISIPVRGRKCDHFQCFDLSSYLQINQSVHVAKKRWKPCPLCGNDEMKPENLVVDTYLKHILETTGDAPSVTFNNDGTYEVSPDESDCDTDTDDDQPGSGAEIKSENNTNTNGHAPFRSSNTAPAKSSADVIDLLSDSDDDSDYTCNRNNSMTSGSRDPWGYFRDTDVFGASSTSATNRRRVLPPQRMSARVDGGIFSSSNVHASSPYDEFWG